MKNVLTAIALMGILTAGSAASARMTDENIQSMEYYLGAPCPLGAPRVEAPCAAPCAAPCVDPCGCAESPWPTKTACISSCENPCGAPTCCPEVLGFMQRNNNFDTKPYRPMYRM
jgi:hypothetical protein